MRSLSAKIVGIWGLLGFAHLGYAAGPAREAESVAGYALPQEGYRFSFPHDHGSHPEFKLEWWYVTGHLWADRRRFGFQATFFRSALHPPPALDQGTNFFGRDHIYLAHMALVDVAGKTYLTEEKAQSKWLGCRSVHE
jgi:predicted secreted hydrolase